MARLRAATRLARLRLADGEPEAAARTLRPVYDTFTEGFATADLVEARELLAGLGIEAVGGGGDADHSPTQVARWPTPARARSTTDGSRSHRATPV